MSDSGKKRVCVIGCGPSGMSMLLELGKLSDEQIPDIVCYEKQDTVGGLWNVTWRTGLDQYGEPVHASMYYDLWINNPHCSNEYPDYTYEEHFGKILPSYVPRAVVRDYLEGRLVHCSKRDLKQYVRCSTVVKRVEYNKDIDDFTVTAKNLKDNKEEVERFSHVVVATGMFSTPNYSDVPGIDDFKGRVLHSKQVKHLNEFKGQRVLVIGSLISAQDLALMLIKFGAESVIIAYKYRPLGRKWPEGIEERHIAVKFDENNVYFQDGSIAEVDVVMFCTGYKLEFPFMPEDLRLKTDMLFHPENLYQGVLWLKGGNNKLMYLGMLYSVFHFITYECQAIWACRNIMETLKLPPGDEMYADSSMWVEKAREASRNHYFPETFEFVKEYFRHIVEIVDYPAVVLELQNAFHKLFYDMAEDICTFRDKQFHCIYTGKTCPAPKVQWMNNFDESLEYFVKQY